MIRFLPILAMMTLAFSAVAQKTFWGMCASKGAIDGTIFKTDSNGNGYTDVYVFANDIDGKDPYGSLMQAADGKLYGMTSGGGAFGYGVIFEINPETGAYNKIHDFDSVNGKTPYGSLLQAANGKLYGMTYGGGLSTPAKDRGILFEYDLSTGNFSNKKTLVQKNATWPYGSLVTGSDGKLYGLSSGGGVDATGMIFQYDYTLDSFTHMGSFISGPAWEGYHPRGQMVQAANGMFYGLSRFGQAMGSGGGVIFKFDPTAGIIDRMSSVYKLSELAPDSTNGYETVGSLIQATDGKLYGMAQFGGTNGAGTIFSYDIGTNTFAKVHDFDAGAEGYGPYGTLMEAGNGMLYGLATSQGGQARLFQWDIATSTFTVKANITGTPYYTSLIEVLPMPTAVANVGKSDFVKVFPNPVRNALNFSVNTYRSGIVYELMSMDGKVLLHGNAQKENCLNTSHLATGSYLLRVSEHGNSMTVTITKE